MCLRVCVFLDTLVYSLKGAKGDPGTKGDPGALGQKGETLLYIYLNS